MEPDKERIKKLPEQIFHRIYYKESEKRPPPDPLDGIVHQLQKTRLNSAHINSHTASEQRSDEHGWKAEHEELDQFFRLIMQQVHVAAQQEESLLAGRLVTLEKVEKHFGSLLLAQIQATEARIRALENQQAKLQSLIEQKGRSVFGFLFIGIKSQLQLRSVRSQLRLLTAQLAELTETNKTFQYARTALLRSRKEKAVSLLERMRHERVEYTFALLFESMQQWIRLAKHREQFLGFCIEEAGVHTVKPLEGFFGIFSHPLPYNEREWLEELCQLHGCDPSHSEKEIRNRIHQCITDHEQNTHYNLANHFLLLIRLLHAHEKKQDAPNTHVLPLYILWNNNVEDLEQWTQSWVLGGSSLVSRLQAILLLIDEIEELHHLHATFSNKEVNRIELRLALARLFRPLVWKTDQLLTLLPKRDKPPLFHHKQWKCELANSCDEAFAWWVTQIIEPNRKPIISEGTG